jgi:hypothetical protein
MIKIDMPRDCRQIVVAFNKSFRIFPSTSEVERYCRRNRYKFYKRVRLEEQQRKSQGLTQEFLDQIRKDM